MLFKLGFLCQKTDRQVPPDLTDSKTLILAIEKLDKTLSSCLGSV